YVSDDLVRDIFNTYLIYTPATKDDNVALSLLKSFLCRALSFHIGEKLNSSDHDQTLNNVKKLDYVTKDLK
ncbi:11519_t:CDS:1, partial [Funneliformis caledonium]